MQTTPAVLMSKAALRRQRKAQKQDVSFTQQELQQLSSLLSFNIRVYAKLRSQYDTIAHRAWDAADRNRKDEPEVKEAFLVFSQAYAASRKVRLRSKTAAALQRKTKQMMRNP